MQIMDGKEVAASLRKQIASEVEALVAAGNRPPHLAAVLVGNDGASQTYVGHKEKCCGEVGFRSTVLRLPEETTEEALLAEIARLNADPDVDGFIVQLPLPKHISEQKVIEAIDPRKDVDGFHPVNTGRMISGLPAYLPATPDGILELLGYYKIETAGKQLADAKAQSAQIIADARSVGEAVKADITAQAQTEAADMIAKAKAAIEAEKKQAISELQATVADTSVDVAARLIGEDLTEGEHRAIIERYVKEAGSFNGN